jgi:hypothetical protein
MEDSEKMRWRSLVLSLTKKAIALLDPSAVPLLALPQKDGTSRPLLEGLLSSLEESQFSFSLHGQIHFSHN